MSTTLLVLGIACYLVYLLATDENSFFVCGEDPVFIGWHHQQCVGDQHDVLP